LPCPTNVLFSLGATNGLHQEVAGPQFDPEPLQGSAAVCTVAEGTLLHDVTFLGKTLWNLH
jgi:hypothetical protein